MIEKIFNSARFLVYCYIYLYGIKFINGITNDMQFWLCLFWTVLWIIESVRFSNGGWSVE